MTGTNATRAEADRDQEFWDLVAADRDLLRAEFDALIAANWPRDPAPPAPDPQARHPDPQRTPVRGAASRAASCPARIGARHRQRSPPDAGRRKTAA